jgi:hypothetical protein
MEKASSDAAVSVRTSPIRIMARDDKTAFFQMASVSSVAFLIVSPGRVEISAPSGAY